MKPETDESDQALVAAMARGDSAALAALMARYMDRLHAFCQRLLGTNGDAEDAVQDTFLAAWRHASGWRQGSAGYATWLHATALNQCRDRLRRRAWEGASLSLDDVPLSDPLPGPEQQASGAQRQRRLIDAIAELPQRQREALTLCVFQNMNQSEAAAVLAISEHALESLLARGRRNLRAHLEPEHGGEPR